MNLVEIVLLGVGLAMDAFAVSVCKGLSVNKIKAKNYLCVGIWFGVFQALMPLVGYYLGYSFEKYVDAFDHWIGFVLLSIIGANMIKESLSKEIIDKNDDFTFKTMLILAIATSIDALVVGISMSLSGISISIFTAVLIIGVETMIISIVGFIIGNVFGSKYKSKAELCGGIILILLGIKILIEGLIF